MGKETTPQCTGQGSLISTLGVLEPGRPPQMVRPLLKAGVVCTSVSSHGLPVPLGMQAVGEGASSLPLLIMTPLPLDSDTSNLASFTKMTLETSSFQMKSHWWLGLPLGVQTIAVGNSSLLLQLGKSFLR